MAKYCANCGAEMPDVATMCPMCGYQVAPTEPVAPAQPEQPTGPQQTTYNTNNTQAYPTEQKSKIVAGLLGIFLGAYGIHNFYLGYTQKAVIQLVLVFVTCGLSGLWGFIEGILILCGNINVDAKGVPLKD